MFFCHRGFTDLRNGHHLEVYRLCHVHLWTLPPFPQSRAEACSSIRSFSQYNFPSAPAEGLVYFFVSLLGYDKNERMLV